MLDHVSTVTITDQANFLHNNNNNNNNHDLLLRSDLARH